ncbi:MAG: NPCBM/NEW2 domain-containing protein, partial [Planctomycetes bacterium]|nr:NPCBM/NEW2 domain-containing protein [Planctomycetota bacterium]
DCIAVLAGDGRELWRARLRGGDAPRSIDLDLAGVKRLELRVEAGERHDIGDHVVLADAQLIRR